MGSRFGSAQQQALLLARLAVDETPLDRERAASLLCVEAQVHDGVVRGLEVTSELRLEVNFCQFLDLAAIALARWGSKQDAAAVVRLGAMVRRDLGHRRTTGDRFMLRRFLEPPFFGAAVRQRVKALRSADLPTMSQRVIGRLREKA